MRPSTHALIQDAAHFARALHLQVADSSQDSLSNSIHLILPIFHPHMYTYSHSPSLDCPSSSSTTLIPPPRSSSTTSSMSHLTLLFTFTFSISASSFSSTQRHSSRFPWPPSTPTFQSSPATRTTPRHLTHRLLSSARSNYSCPQPIQPIVESPASTRNPLAASSNNKNSPQPSRGPTAVAEQRQCPFCPIPSNCPSRLAYSLAHASTNSILPMSRPPTAVSLARDNGILLPERPGMCPHQMRYASHTHTDTPRTGAGCHSLACHSVARQIM